MWGDAALFVAAGIGGAIGFFFGVLVASVKRERDGDDWDRDNWRR